MDNGLGGAVGGKHDVGHIECFGVILIEVRLWGMLYGANSCIHREQRFCSLSYNSVRKDLPVGCLHILSKSI